MSKNEILRQHIGERIRSARDGAGRSREQLASMTGLGNATITHYEQGGGDIPLFRLLDIAHALCRPIAYFLPPDPFSRVLEKRIQALSVSQQEILERLLHEFEALNARK